MARDPGGSAGSVGDPAGALILLPLELERLDDLGMHERLDAPEADPGRGSPEGDVEDRAEERRVGLFANSHVDLVLLERRALGPDVETDDSRQWTEVLLPELQGSAFSAADLDEGHRPVYEEAEVALVDWKVVRPLVDGAAFMI